MHITKLDPFRAFNKQTFVCALLPMIIFECIPPFAQLNEICNITHEPGQLSVFWWFCQDFSLLNYVSLSFLQFIRK